MECRVLVLIAVSVIITLILHTRTCTHPEIHDAFLAPGECDRVIRYAKARGLDRSTVTDAQKGAARDTARTSSHVFLEDGDPVGEMIRDRVSRLTGAPVSRMEHVQILRYMPGEEYRAHFDACNDGCDGGRDMPRTETVLVYLNHVDEGGHTEFPTAGVSVAPKPGRAVRWPNIDATGTNLPCSFHAGTPVIRGEKWAATVWIR